MKNMILFSTVSILWLLASVNSSGLPGIQGAPHISLDQSQCYMDSSKGWVFPHGSAELLKEIKDFTVHFSCL